MLQQLKTKNSVFIQFQFQKLKFLAVANTIVKRTARSQLRIKENLSLAFVSVSGGGRIIQTQAKSL
jgi:hypothetical protein